MELEFRTVDNKSHSHSTISSGSIQENGSTNLKDAVHYLSELEGSYDAEVLCQACLRLSEIIKRADSDCLHLLLDIDVMGAIIRMMEALPSHSSAQQAGCNAILICNELVELRATLEDNKAFSQVLTAIKTHPNDTALMAEALHALASLAGTAVNEAALKETRAHQDIISALSTHPDNVDIQMGGLLALASLLEMDSFALSTIALQGDYDFIFDSVMMHSLNPGVVAHGFHCLRSIIRCDINCDKLQKLRSNLASVIEILVHHMENEGVATAALGLIEALCAADLRQINEMTLPEDAQLYLATLQDDFKKILQKFLDLVTQLLERFTELIDIQLYGFNTLRCILTLFLVEAPDSLLDKWLKLLNVAMNYHRENNDMNEVGCLLLSELLILKSLLHSRIGDTEDKIPLHNNVWMVLLSLSYDPSSSLFIAASTSLRHLIECDASLQQYFLKKGATVALIECLREYTGEIDRNEECVECGCRALRSILMHHCSDEQKQYLLDVGIFGDLQLIVDGFMYNSDVIAEAFCVIACLSDLSKFQADVVTHSLYKGIVEAMNKHTSNEILIEVALEIFIILSLNAQMTHCLNEVDILGITVSVMKKHVTYSSIQFKGCMLIRLLCDPKYLTESSCTATSSVIIDALSRKKDSKVQSEALACAQTLCRSSKQMAKSLVKGDIHILLFTLLYRDVSYAEKMKGNILEFEMSGTADYSDSKVEDFFLQVGTDIIYTLGCIWDFKQEMLTTTIKDGLLEGVSVLIEIGADINSAENEEVIPICLAVHSRNTKMVEFLFEHGITNVNVQKALKISWDLNLDDITGLLLEHIAVDRSRDSVNMSGLELTKIEPLWILPSLGVKQLPQAPSNYRRCHKKQRSLGHVKDVLKDVIVRRKSGIEISKTEGPSQIHQKSSGTRRESVDLSSLMYISDKEKGDEVEETDFGACRKVAEETLATCAKKDLALDLTSVPCIKDDEIVDSGVDTVTGRNIITTLSPIESKFGLQSFFPSRGIHHNSSQGTISGTTALPCSQLDQYTLDKGDKNTSRNMKSFSSVDFSLSPTQLFRQVRKHHRRRSKRILSESSSSNFSHQSDSPSIMYYGNCRDNELSSSSIFSPVDGRSVSLKYSSPSGDEAGAFKDESSVISQAVSLTPNSSSTSHETSRMLTFNSSQSSNAKDYDEVDFGGYEPIPEESLQEEFNSRLIKLLDLSSNHLCNFNLLSHLPYGGVLLFKRLRGVCTLDVKQNKLTALLTDMMKEMPMLSKIDLSCNAFTVFPLEAMFSARLTEVDLSSNQLTEIPSLPVMTNLTRFNLCNNELISMPECVHKDTGEPSFPHLRYFDLRSNHISTIPNLYTKLHDLEVLNISKNHIELLPDEFLASMPSLRILDASMNDISHIGGVIGQDMVHLQEVRVASNNLGKDEVFFNNFITSIPVLQVIDARENGLLSIPPPYAWKSLGVREIKYTGNKLTKIDLSDCKRFWSRLECLYLGQNQLKAIPKEMGQLRSLSCLDISHNKDIRQLPDEMGDLSHLFMLNLQGLKNLSLDPNILNGPTKRITSYLKSRYTRSVPYYHMKMMIVGAAERGKTTVLHNLIQANGKSNLKTNVATMGVNVKQWNYQHKKPVGNVVTYHINCWDFAGQQEFYSTHQCFLSQRSLYVLVYNLYHGDSELEYIQLWLLNIQARAPSSPVIIVGTHLDNFKLSQDEVDTKRLAMRMIIKDMLRNPGYPNDVSFAEISCFNDKHINDLRMKIKGLIDSTKLHGQKIMGGLVPSNYIALEELILKERKHIEQMKSRFPVLRESRLRELMEESKLNSKMDKSEMLQAIKFLHECGVLLHYNDFQTKLSELYFLDPEWLCILMAHVITFKHISFVNEKGMKSVPHLLKEPRFPSQYIPEYIRLLERFEVVIRHTDDQLLIPSRLPKDRPPEVPTLPEILGARLVRRYSLCYIPPGLWPRLIARLISFKKITVSANKGYDEPIASHMWSGGIYMYWSESYYFILELLPHHHQYSFDIIVPTTCESVQLLCSIVDNVESLVDEWFPGLRDLSIIGGAELITPLALCPLCPAGSNPHQFLLKHLIQLAYAVDEVECPIHKGKVKLESLAPDIIIGDLDPKYRILPDELSLIESPNVLGKLNHSHQNVLDMLISNVNTNPNFFLSPQNVLGKGGFGDVYKANCRGETVAVKIFSQSVAAINNTTPNQLIRQETQILSRLKHPNVISMVGVCLKPKAMLLLEYAELGSLSSMRPYSNINQTIKHKIALQISSALSFLHKNGIIYRDLKPGNILIFSLSTLVKVNAKLSDYGIACYTTAAGLTQSVGTPGYRAPELLLSTSSNMSYHDKVDVYSYGLMLFELLTNGHKPFEELSAGCEIDKFIVEGRPINDIDFYGCSPWPDMQDVINHCLQYLPAQRPSAQEICDRLCSSEFMCLKRAISIERNHTVETFTIRNFLDKHKTKNVQVWVVSTLGSQSMVSILNLTPKNAAPKGMMMPPNTLIYSMVAVNSSFVLMGSNSGSIFVYDGYDQMLKHSLRSLEDSVLCLIHVKSSTENAYYVCAGLANGHVAFYDNTLLMTPNANGQIINVGTGPVKSMKRYHSRLYITCGPDVVVMKISNLKIERRWTAIEDQTNSSYLTNIEVGLNYIWTTQNKSAKLHVWDQDDGNLIGVRNCDNIINSMLPANQALSSYEARITAILLQQSPYSILWIGLGSGHLLVLNAISQIPLMTVKRHVTTVRCLQLVKAMIAEKPVNLVISGGFGFQQRPGYSAPNRGTPETYGSLLVWDSIMPRLKSTYDAIKEDIDIYR